MEIDGYLTADVDTEFYGQILEEDGTIHLGSLTGESFYLRIGLGPKDLGMLVYGTVMRASSGHAMNKVFSDDGREDALYALDDGFAEEDHDE